MHAFLIHSSNLDFIKLKSAELIVALQSIKLDYQLQTIDHVREITRFTKLTAKQKTTIYIENIDTASTEAQNAFLKTLEEPQENISFILTATNIENVTSTIISRVEVIEDQTGQSSSEENKQTALNFFGASIGEQLSITSKLKKREEAVEFLISLIKGGHELVLEDSNYAYSLEKAQNALNAIKKNGNIQIQLTNFIVQLHS